MNHTAEIQLAHGTEKTKENVTSWTQHTCCEHLNTRSQKQIIPKTGSKFVNMIVNQKHSPDYYQVYQGQTKELLHPLWTVHAFVRGGSWQT